MTSSGSDDRNWHRHALTAVVLGAMFVSIFGQVAAIEKAIGTWPAIVLALVNDGGAIIALDLVLGAPKDAKALSRWGWVAILLASSTGGAQNVWHVTNGEHPPPIPRELALLVGAEPIVLILVLSHVVRLGMALRRATRLADNRHTDSAVAAAGADQQPLHVTVGPAAPQPPTGRTNSATSSPAGWRPTAPAALPTGRPTAPAPAAVDTAVDATGWQSDNGTRHADRQPTPVSRNPSPPTVGRVLHAVPEPRPDWMTEPLLRRVVEAMAKALAAEESYGAPRLMKEHRLDDGLRLSRHKADAVLKYIAKHDLLRETA